MQILRKLTNGAYEVVCGHAEELCEPVRVVFFVDEHRETYFPTRSLVTEAIKGSTVAREKITPANKVLQETASKPIEAWCTMVAALRQNRASFF